MMNAMEATTMTRATISTATVYASEEEWARFKIICRSPGHFRQEAEELAWLAWQAVETKSFRILPLPKGARRSRQIKTVLAGPYLAELVKRVKQETGRDVSATDIAESLIRALSTQ
jgi:hypothetical protein